MKERGWQMSNENYVSRTSRLLKSFDGAVSRVKPILVARYGAEESKVLIPESRQWSTKLLQTPLDFVYSREGAIEWLLIMIGLSALASLLPALRASQWSVGETLAYE